MRHNGYLAFGVGICLTLWTCWFVMQTQQRHIRDNFQRDADKVARDTAVRLQTYFDTLLSLKALYAQQQRVDRAGFHHFVRELNLGQRYPGFQAIQYVRVVPEAGLPAFVEAVRREDSGTGATGAAASSGAGAPFQVHPVAPRALHYVIEYTDPMRGNESAWGLDLAALAPHRKALEMGRDSGEIIATERITLVQDNSGQAGFVARAPVYREAVSSVAQRRAALDGFVAIVFRVETLMREVIAAELLLQLRVRINDAGYLADGGAAPASAGNLMFDSAAQRGAMPAGVTASNPASSTASSSAATDTLPSLASGTSLVVGQRRWQLRFDGLPGARYSPDPLPVLQVGLAGVVISALIAALLAAQQRLAGAKRGLERSMAELERQKTSAERAHHELSAAMRTLELARGELITSEKMASLGALVAGVAHELNTPIGNSLLTATALSDMVEQFQRQLTHGVKRSALDGHLTDVKAACTIMTGSLVRAAELINSFKQVAVDQSSGQRRAFALDSVVTDTLAAYAAQMRRAGCVLRLQLEPGLVLDTYPGSLGQVLGNLAGNTLLHGLEGRDSGEMSIAARSLEHNMVELVFSDDGVGMPAPVLRQIFDPFFTTRMGQGGSGLGMNIVYNIVTGVLRGTIQVASEPGRGTSVTMLLPRSLGQASIQP